MTGRWTWARVALACVAMSMGACGDDAGGDGTMDADVDVAAVPVCGNGIVEEGEDCDEGPGGNIDGSGCDSDCTFSCHADADCDDGNPCNGEETCSASLHRCQAGTSPEEGTACTLMLPGSPPGDGDAGVPDGGAADADGGTAPDGGLVPVESKCIAEVCALPCSEDAHCEDDNPCTGDMTCDLELEGCRRDPPDCDDGYECTIDDCDPEENPEEGCVHTLIDEDGDGYAPEGLDCDDRGGDCDDTDPNINPGMPTICDDGIDNNCTGFTDDDNVWYQDCDGDGYAREDAPFLIQCEKPGPSGDCDWTVRPPDGDRIDCNDQNPNVNPGIDEHQSTPYCTGSSAMGSLSGGSWTCASGSPSWDFNCDGDEDPLWTRAGSDECSSVSHCSIGGCSYWCTRTGWTTEDPPDCGVLGDYRQCDCSGVICSGFCTETLTSQRQRCL